MLIFVYILLQKAGVAFCDFVNAMNILAKKETVILEREPDECWVNAYNPELLRAWNANMDIQYITDPFSCVMYIVSYITKSERELGQLIKHAQKEAREENLDAISELRTLGNKYLTHREVSIMEAVYRGIGLQLKRSSRVVVFVPTDPKCTR